MEPKREIKGRSENVWMIETTHTDAQFFIKSFFFFTVKGRLSEVTGAITRDEDDIRRSSVQATIKAASIETGNQRRDAHLRSLSFLDAENHSVIRFLSTGVERGTDRDTLRVKGMLTIKGRSREVSLDITEIERSRSPRGEEIAYYTVRAKLDRFDFGITALRGLTGRNVTVTIHVQAMKQK
jgi:polyisoprenoid-binding protein YceI